MGRNPCRLKPRCVWCRALFRIAAEMKREVEVQGILPKPGDLLKVHATKPTRSLLARCALGGFWLAPTKISRGRDVED